MGKWKFISTIISFGSVWILVFRFTPGPLYHWANSPRCPLDRKQSELQNWYRQHEVERNLFPLTVLKPGQIFLHAKTSNRKSFSRGVKFFLMRKRILL
jgi:hypothetical protein